MARQEKRHVETYYAVDDNGGRHKINVYQTFTEYELLSGERQWLGGIKAHKMASNGNHVNVSSDDGSLEDVHTGTKMRRV